MFEVGEYIVYGNTGVCKVEKVGPLESAGTSNDRIYYTLSPCYSKGSTIFTPADNQKVIMRPVITREEADKLVEDIKDIESLGITDEKRREQDYKEAFKKCDCREMVRIIKTIYQHKEARIAEGKKVTAGDEKYFHMAEESLYGELAIPLEMDKDEVKKFIIQKVESKEEV